MLGFGLPGTTCLGFTGNSTGQTLNPKTPKIGLGFVMSWCGADAGGSATRTEKPPEP